MNAIRTVTDIGTHLARGKTTLGALVYWNGIHDVRVPRATFRAEFERMGLGEAVGADPKAEACLNMAARSAATKGKRRGTVKIQRTEKGTHAVYAVLMRRDVAAFAGQAGPDQRIRFLEEARVMVDRGQPQPYPTTVVASDVDQDDARDEVIADMIGEYIDLLGNVRWKECSEALTAAMDLLGGLSLRPGVYFVPATNLTRTRELQTFLSSQGMVDLTVWTIAGDDENATQSKADAWGALFNRVQELRNECQELATAKGEDIAIKSINARLKRFQALDDQAQLYADILGDRAQELRDAIEAARRGFREAVLGDD